MDFTLSDEQQLIRETARDFTNAEIVPRARENDPRRQEGLQAARATMAEIFDGAPEFVDLTVVGEISP